MAGAAYELATGQGIADGEAVTLVTKKPAFKRELAPLPIRVAMSAVVYGFLTPLMRGLQVVGLEGAFLKRMGNRDRARGNPFQNYVADKHDVFVAVFFKSGTNWTMQIVHQLLNHGKGEFDHIHSVVPWPDAPPFLGKYAIPVEDPSVWMASPEQKRAIKTHLSWDLLPYSEDARYVLVIRDPKDVIVSGYFFLRDVVFRSAMPSPAAWCQNFLTGSGGMGSWAEHSVGYWAQRHRSNVLLLSFKSMQHDLNGTVAKIAKFLDVNVAEESLAEVCRKSSFGYMKQIDERFAPEGVHPWGRKVTMMRKGVHGGSSELLTKEQQRAVDAHFIAELKRLGSDLPYEEFCELA